MPGGSSAEPQGPNPANALGTRFPYVAFAVRSRQYQFTVLMHGRYLFLLSTIPLFLNLMSSVESLAAAYQLQHLQAYAFYIRLA